MCFCSSARPPPPNFTVDCALLGDGCLKINTPFCNARLDKEATLKLGGAGVQRTQQQRQIEKECFFLPHRTPTSDQSPPCIDNNKVEFAMSRHEASICQLMSLKALLSRSGACWPEASCVGWHALFWQAVPFPFARVWGVVALVLSFSSCWLALMVRISEKSKCGNSC